MIYEKQKEINFELMSAIRGEGLNYARLLLPESRGELSVIGKYLPELIARGDVPDFIKNESDGERWRRGYITLNTKLDAVPLDEGAEFYYGVSPKLNGSLIISEISRLSLSDKAGLLNFIKSNSGLFMLHRGQEKFLFPLAEYITVCVSHNFGIKLTLGESILGELQAATDMDNRYFEITKDGILKLHGCPTARTLAFLEKLTYSEIEAGHFRADVNGSLSIRDIYANQKNIIFINGSHFYSGVLPRVLFIEEKEKWHSNKGITSMYLYYERSTYATVFSLDRDYTAHPLLSDVKEDIIKFFRYDDGQKRRHLTKQLEDGAEGRRKLLSQVNEYLRNSYNVNQIVVAGNIVTSDGILVVCERGDDEIDSGKLYPSVNGNVEIADRDVEFYTDSANVDLPTIELSSLQSGFATELCRETEAELNVSLSNNLWKCYGIALAGTIPDEESDPDSDEYPFAKRRMHFGIIYEQTVNLSFEDITKAQKSAVERHESRNILGLSLKVYNNPFDFVKKLLYGIISGISRWKLLITSIFTLALFFLSMSNLHFSLKDWSSTVSAVFAALVIIIALFDTRKKLAKIIYNRTHIRKININSTADHGKISKKLNSYLAPYIKPKEHYPIAYLALDIYITKKAAPKKKRNKKRKE